MHRWHVFLLLAVAGCSLDSHSPLGTSQNAARTGNVRGLFLDAGSRPSNDATHAPDAGAKGTAVTKPTKTPTMDAAMATRQPSHDADNEDAGPTMPHDAGARDSAVADAAPRQHDAGKHDSGPPAAGKSSEPSAGNSAGSGSPDARTALIATLSELARRQPNDARAIIALEAYVSSGNPLPVAVVPTLLVLVDESFDCAGSEANACESACAYVASSCTMCVANDNCRSELRAVCGAAAQRCR
jgi:hypothetical protein